MRPRGRRDRDCDAAALVVAARIPASVAATCTTLPAAGAGAGRAVERTPPAMRSAAAERPRRRRPRGRPVAAGAEHGLSVQGAGWPGARAAGPSTVGSTSRRIRSATGGRREVEHWHRARGSRRRQGASRQRRRVEATDRAWPHTPPHRSLPDACELGADIRTRDRAALAGSRAVRSAAARIGGAVVDFSWANRLERWCRGRHQRRGRRAAAPSRCRPHEPARRGRDAQHAHRLQPERRASRARRWSRRRARTARGRARAGSGSCGGA